MVSSGVKEEPPVRASAVPSVVVFAIGSDRLPVVNAGRVPALNHSSSMECNSVEVGPPSVDRASRHVAVGRVDWEYPEEQFDDILFQSYGHPGNGRQLLPPTAPLYNKYVGGRFSHKSHCYLGSGTLPKH